MSKREKTYNYLNLSYKEVDELIEKYESIKIEYGLTNNDIAHFFCYKDEGSLKNATRFPGIMQGVVRLHELMKKSE